MSPDPPCHVRGTLLSHRSPASGENVAADVSADLSKLEVSLTLTNKFEGLETGADDSSAQSLLLRWVTVASEPPGPSRGPTLKWPPTCFRKRPQLLSPRLPPGHLGFQAALEAGDELGCWQQHTCHVFTGHLSVGRHVTLVTAACIRGETGLWLTQRTARRGGLVLWGDRWELAFQVCKSESGPGRASWSPRQRAATWPPPCQQHGSLLTQEVGGLGLGVTLPSKAPSRPAWGEHVARAPWEGSVRWELRGGTPGGRNTSQRTGRKTLWRAR